MDVRESFFEDKYEFVFCVLVFEFGFLDFVV